MQKFQIPCVLLCGGKSSRMGADKCFLKFRGQSLVKWQFERLCALFENVFISCKNDKFGGEFEEKMLIFDENLGFNANFEANLGENSSPALNLNENLSENSRFAANLNENLSENLDFVANLNSQNANFRINSKQNLQKAANFWENSSKNSRKSEDFSPMLALYSILRHFQRGFVFIIAVDMPFLSKDSIARLILAANSAQIILPRTANKEHFLCGLYESALYPLCLEFLQNKSHKIRLLTQKVATKFIDFSDESEFLNLNTPQDYERAKNV